MKEEDSSPEISEKEMLRGLRRRLPLERLRITVKTCGVDYFAFSFSRVKF